MEGATGVSRHSRRIQVTAKFQFHSFRTRILVFFLGLLVLVQAGVFIAVNTANENSARTVIDEALLVAASVFDRQLTARSHELLLAARLLSSDYAFKEAYATHEHPTVLSALSNHRQRISADVMMLVSMQGKVMVDTLHPSHSAVDNVFPDLLAAAEKSDFGEASGVTILDGRPYQMVIVPLFIPHADAWVCIGFAIGDDFAKGLQEVTLSHVSFLLADTSNRWQVFASTLPESLRGKLTGALVESSGGLNNSTTFDMGRDLYVSLVTPMNGDTTRGVVAVLQRSLSQALEPYRRLRVALLGLFVAGGLLSVLGAFLIARSVTRPVLKLAEGARSVEHGDYTKSVDIKQHDEIGRLANSFNHMLKGLVERDHIRNLLGKVVSPAIAEELLARDIELGGEEREVTVLFSDIRDFTGLCENRSPQDILTLLNAYLTEVSGVVEVNGGVVDKYIGDCMMAIFGAPLDYANHAERAIKTALGICEAIQKFNKNVTLYGWPELNAGVGINSAQVVAGNMGSITRLNYTVIGDGVNLASRLEALTKRYGVNILVSATTKQLASNYLFRELDVVCVKGKREAITIYEPLCLRDRADQAVLDELELYYQALGDYRDRRWNRALAGFTRLGSSTPEYRPYQIYLERLAHFKLAPPDDAWDGTHVWHEK